MALGDDVDSGMSSENSKADTPEKQLAIEHPDVEEDDEEDETIGERLWGLTEMFPDPVRNAIEATAYGVVELVKGSYSLTRQAAWVLSTGSIILFAPVMFEVERNNAQEALRRDQQQVLLGPNAAGLR